MRENQLGETSDLIKIYEHHVCVYFCFTDLYKFSPDFSNQSVLTTVPLTGDHRIKAGFTVYCRLILKI